MPKHPGSFLVAALAGAFALTCHAEHSGTGPFDSLARDQVLSQSSVHALAQDRKGYLWIGTQAGLDRYDGYRIRSWKSDADDPQTLSHGFIKDLLVAADGTLWVGTARGLDRLDPDTGALSRLPVQLPDGSRTSGDIDAGSLVEDGNGDIYATGLNPSQPLRWRPGRPTLEPVEVAGRLAPVQRSGARAALTRDRAGRIWLAGRGGLWRLDRETDRFEPVLRVETDKRIPVVTEHVLTAGPGNGISYASAEGLFIVDPDAEPAIRHLRPARHGFDSDATRAVASDSRGALWFTAPGVVGRLDRDGRWQRFDQPSLDQRDRENRGAHTLHLEETPDGDIWLAGLFGLLRFDPESSRMHRYRHDPNDPSSPPPTVAENGYRIFLDRFGTLWIGGHLGGIARLPPHAERFLHVRDTAPSNTNRNIVRAITEQRLDEREFVWVANQNHGVTAWERSGPKDYRLAARYEPGGGISRIGVVRDIAIDPADDSVWLAGTIGLGRVETAGEPIEVVEFSGRPAPASLRTLQFTEPGRAVAAGGANGRTRIWLLETAGGRPSIRRTLTAPDEPRSQTIFHVAPRSNGDLVATYGDGILLLDPESGEVGRHFPGLHPRREAARPLFMLSPDGNGGFWAGTRGAGLLHIRFIGRDQPVFSRITAEDGLPDETVYAILPDATGKLWLSTNRGIVRFDPDARSFNQYTPGDGLQGWEFNHAVAHIGESGRYYFGGVFGWNVFEPGRVRPLLQPPELDLTGVFVNDRPLAIGPDRRLPPLRHDRNRLVIDYAGLHFAAPDRIRYQYRLDGVDDDWIDAGTTPQARYASLTPGKYRFEVRAANLDGIWSAAEELLRFEILRPPWATPWAWALYAAAAAVLVLTVLAQQKRKRHRLQILVDKRTEELRQQNELVDHQARQLEAALRARTTLFANVSHEFRTPLTLIQASIDRLAVAPDPDAVATARRYSGRLLRLVEQLLDLSRLRLGRAPRPEPQWRLDSVVSQTVEAFRPVADERRVALETRINGAWHTECPQDLVEKILLNLLSNAIKFTPAGGRVTVSLEPSGNEAELAVADTGPGIAQADQERIFERFYRAESAENDRTVGAGIGLALVFESARAAGGRLHLDSAPGRGSRFSVTLPAERPIPGSLQRPPETDAERRELDVATLLTTTPADTAPSHRAEAASPAESLLVVEDNPDLREYLANALSDRWHVVLAADGREGLERARELQPDLIVSDLMMPHVDGFEMLSALRTNIDTSHIPVLMLTARQDEDTRLKAFTLSADGFLAKPFRIDELKARLAQMILQRERTQAWARGQRTAEPRAGQDADGEPPADAISDRDRRMLETLERWLAEHFADPQLDIGAMAEAVHVAPRTLQRKLKSLLGQSPAHFIRDFRMARARELLRETDRSVTEIALAVGYSSSQYFSRAFRQVHGRPPEAWRRTVDSSTD
ncbi:MAG: ATP-binding protein [Candidatus Wenzhouxiangella sp. M2_3B_020]